jgi:hypothetical protein
MGQIPTQAIRGRDCGYRLRRAGEMCSLLRLRHAGCPATMGLPPCSGDWLELAADRCRAVHTWARLHLQRKDRKAGSLRPSGFELVPGCRFTGWCGVQVKGLCGWGAMCHRGTMSTYRKFHTAPSLVHAVYDYRSVAGNEEDIPIANVVSYRFNRAGKQ